MCPSLQAAATTKSTTKSKLNFPDKSNIPGVKFPLRSSSQMEEDDWSVNRDESMEKTRKKKFWVADADFFKIAFFFGVHDFYF